MSVKNVQTVSSSIHSTSNSGEYRCERSVYQKPTGYCFSYWQYSDHLPGGTVAYPPPETRCSPYDSWWTHACRWCSNVVTNVWGTGGPNTEGGGNVENVGITAEDIEAENPDYYESLIGPGYHQYTYISDAVCKIGEQAARKKPSLMR
ncbi:hypothetical protein [Veronia nyctiphanis]|uniref:hypothetical protein n=1 Tax=Veronia nyctiphanis TaxID=1278244 RepID=UPI00100AB467|nr:hypothetical protein [Veronia nyctiphanis]